MKEIMCRFNLFAMDQQIYLVDDSGAKKIGVTSIFDMANDMLKLSKWDDTNVNKFHLYGPTQYAEMIAKQLKQLAASDYSENNIEVEIN